MHSHPKGQGGRCSGRISYVQILISIYIYVHIHIYKLAGEEIKPDVSIDSQVSRNVFLCHGSPTPRFVRSCCEPKKRTIDTCTCTARAREYERRQEKKRSYRSLGKKKDIEIIGLQRARTRYVAKRMLFVSVEISKHFNPSVFVNQEHEHLTVA